MSEGRTLSEESEKDVLVLSDDIRGKTGFAVNGRLVCYALAKKWDVANAALNADGAGQVEIKGRTVDVYPAPTGPDAQGDELGELGMRRLCEKFDPDVVVSLIDVQMCGYLSQLRQPMSGEVNLRDPGEDIDVEDVIEDATTNLRKMELGQNFEWVAHVPVDGRGLPKQWGPWLKEVDYPVAMSSFGRDALTESFQWVDPYVIPHGVDYRNVQPVESPGFLVGTVNRNQFRKQYPRLIEAWGKFYEMAGRPDDVQFYAHCDYDDEMGWPLDRYFEKYGVADAVVPYKGKVSRYKLMQLYNQFDVFTSATGGEGFGLTTIEAMVQECPVLITYYTTSKELVVEGEPGPRGSVIEPALMYDEHPQFSAVERALVDTDAFAETLLEYYDDPGRVTTEGQKAREWVRSELSWTKVANQWVELFESEVMA